MPLAGRGPVTAAPHIGLSQVVSRRRRASDASLTSSAPAKSGLRRRGRYDEHPRRCSGIGGAHLWAACCGCVDLAHRSQAHSMCCSGELLVLVIGRCAIIGTSRSTCERP